jgi:hypothetical protein
MLSFWIVCPGGWFSRHGGKKMHMELFFQLRCGFSVSAFSGFSLFGITPIDRAIYSTSEALTYRSPRKLKKHNAKIFA